VTLVDGPSPRVLGVFAHPDDEIFCAGGTLAKYAAAGAHTSVVSATRGEAGQIRDASGPGYLFRGSAAACSKDHATHVVTAGQVTCLVLSPEPPERLAGRAVAIALRSTWPRVLRTRQPEQRRALR